MDVDVCTVRIGCEGAMCVYVCIICVNTKNIYMGCVDRESVHSGRTSSSGGRGWRVVRVNGGLVGTYRRR